MPLLSPEGSRKLDNVLGAAAPATPAGPPSQARHPEERASMPSGPNPKPTRGPLQNHQASPRSGAGTGIEKSMHDLADQLHPTKRR